MSLIESLSDSPHYSIKSVCAQTGIMAVTLRAWERRYNILTPHRTTSNYRLYSEQDIAILRWLKSQVDGGIPISAAAAELSEMRSRGRLPEVLPALETVNSSVSLTPPDQFAERIYKALIHHDEDTAGKLLTEAHSLFDLMTICSEIMIPCLIMIGDAWHKGEILISTEHLATNYLRGRLVTLFQSYPNRRGAPYVIVTCTPSDQHEIGSLMLATLLRRDGYYVEYLGTGVPTEDLVDFLQGEHPDLVCLSASSEETAREILKIKKRIDSVNLSTKIGYGGRAFALNPHLCTETPGVFLGQNIREAHGAIRQLLGTY